MNVSDKIETNVSTIMDMDFDQLVESLSNKDINISNDEFDFSKKSDQNLDFSSDPDFIALDKFLQDFSESQDFGLINFIKSKFREKNFVNDKLSRLSFDKNSNKAFMNDDNGTYGFKVAGNNEDDKQFNYNKLRSAYAKDLKRQNKYQDLVSKFQAKLDSGSDSDRVKAKLDNYKSMMGNTEFEKAKQLYGEKVQPQSKSTESESKVNTQSKTPSTSTFTQAEIDKLRSENESLKKSANPSTETKNSDGIHRITTLGGNHVIVDDDTYKKELKLGNIQREHTEEEYNKLFDTKKEDTPKTYKGLSKPDFNEETYESIDDRAKRQAEEARKKELNDNWNNTKSELMNKGLGIANDALSKLKDVFSPTYSANRLEESSQGKKYLDMMRKNLGYKKGEDVSESTFNESVNRANKLASYGDSVKGRETFFGRLAAKSAMKNIAKGKDPNSNTFLSKLGQYREEHKMKKDPFYAQKRLGYMNSFNKNLKDLFLGGSSIDYSAPDEVNSESQSMDLGILPGADEILNTSYEVQLPNAQVTEVLRENFESTPKEDLDFIENNVKNFSSPDKKFFSLEDLSSDQFSIF